MKRLFLIYLLYQILFYQLSAQNIEVASINNFPFSEGLISSENILAKSNLNSSFFASAILTVDQNSSPPNYFTTVFTSTDSGKSWEKEPIQAFPKAADPWISFTGNNEILMTEISDGDKYILRSHFYKGGKWEKAISHGEGHDHAMVVYDQERQLTYLISTIQRNNKKFLYLAISENGGKSFNKKYYHTPFHGVDFNVKQPVINKDGNLLFPVVVRGSLSAEGEDAPFEQMNTWLISTDNHGKTISSPEFMTSITGRKHHIMVKDDQSNLFFIYTNVARNKLEVISRIKGEGYWSEPIIINGELNQKWVNLDAAIVQNNNLIVLWTSEVEKGNYQKYISVSKVDKLHFRKPFLIGKMSKPSDNNGWVKRAWPQGGDYCGLVSGANNIVYILWSHAAHGLFKPKFSKVIIK